MANKIQLSTKKCIIHCPKCLMPFEGYDEIQAIRTLEYHTLLDHNPIILATRDLYGNYAGQTWD